MQELLSIPDDVVGPRHGQGRRAKGSLNVGEAVGDKIDDVFRYDFITNPKDRIANEAMRLLREATMASQAQMVKLVAGHRERGIRCIVLCRYEEVVCVCIYRCVRGPKSVFLEIASFTTDGNRRKEGNGALLCSVIKHLAWKHGATQMLVHSRSTPEAKGFWIAMGFKAASRFTAQLVDVDGGDWGWGDTALMEQNVEHMAHISDQLLKVYRKPAPYTCNLNALRDNMCVWARVRRVWHPAKVLVADGDTANVVLLALNEVHTSMPVEDLRPHREYAEELLPREGEEDLEMVNLGLEKTKALILENKELADPDIQIDPRYIPGLLGKEGASLEEDSDEMETLTAEEESLLGSIRMAAAAHREEADHVEAERESRLLVEFRREASGPLGLTLKSINLDNEKVPGGAVVSAIKCPESHPKRIKVGLLVVEVQGENVSGMSFTQIVSKVRQAGRPLTLKFEPRQLELTTDTVEEATLKVGFTEEEGHIAAQETPTGGETAVEEVTGVEEGDEKRELSRDESVVVKDGNV